MSLSAYPAYKRSDAPWMGDIPEHWRIVPLRALTLSRCDGPFGSGLKSEHYADSGVRVVRLQNIRKGEFDASDAAYVALDHYQRELTGHDVKAGDLLVAGLGDDNNTVGRACVAPAGIEPAMVKADCFRFRVDISKVNPKYLAYQLTAGAPYDAGMLSSGSTRSRISLTDMAARRVALPPLSEQSSVLSFLAVELEKVDSLSAEQGRLLGLLEEKRQAVITEVVAKGVDPGARLNHSGLDWLGTVPETWPIRKLRHLARLESGHTPSRQHPEYWVEEECVIPWFTLADVGFLRDERNIVIERTSQKISKVGMENSAARLLPAGTVILSRTASVGFSGIAGHPMAVSQDFAAWICSPRIQPRYLLFCLRAMKAEFQRLMMGSTHQTIYMPDIEAFRVPVPPVPEQSEIVAFIESETAKLDALTTEAERAIVLLKERRASLISAAVTGKVDVRGLAPVAQEAA